MRSADTIVALRFVPGTVLGQLVAGMSAGTWAEWTGVTNLSAYVNRGGVEQDILPFCTQHPWNPIERRIELIGADHGGSGGDGSMMHVQVTEGTNAATDLGTTGLAGHGYEQTACNPYTGDLYSHEYGPYPSPFFKRKLNSGGAWASIPQCTRGDLTIAIGVCWWSGGFTGAGAQGALFCSTMEFNGGVAGFDPLANSWVYSQGMGLANLGGAYHSVMCYSAAKNCAVFGGGNGRPSSLFKLSSTGAITTMNAPPFGVGTQAALLTCDPVTGNFLIWGGPSRQLYELNPDGSGTYTLLTGARVPPTYVNSPGSSPSGSVTGVICSTHGVVLMVSGGSASTPARIGVYRHA